MQVSGNSSFYQFLVPVSGAFVAGLITDGWRRRVRSTGQSEAVHIPGICGAARPVCPLHHLFRARDQEQDIRGDRQCLHV